MSFQEKISQWFWNEHVWLPPNVTWNDIKPNDKIHYANSKDLYIPLFIAIGLLILRYFLEKFCFAPFGLYLGIKHRKIKKAVANTELEFLYKTKRKISYREIEEVTKKLDWTQRQVERWLRIRKQQDRPTTLMKFCENSFRCTYYVYSFIYGLVILWDKPWLWDIMRCWDDFPHQGVTAGIWWYYMISLSFYWSLAVSQFFDVKHKDFWQMFVHHFATIVLMDFSWICNMHRIGSLVLVVHDLADIFLEGAKMAKYANYQRVCDLIFGTFTLIWITTRIGVYPFWIIRNTSIDAPKVVPMFPAYYIFNSLLLLLLVLHVFWTYLILQIAYNSILVGKMDGDIRSSSSDEIQDSPTTSSVVGNGTVKKED